MEDDLKLSMDAWVRNYIAEFRVAAARNASQKLGLLASIFDDFSAPCQVHLFWFRLEEPPVDYAVLLCTRVKNLPDDLVEVVGPISPPQIKNKLLEVVRWPRWEEKIKDPGFLLPKDASLGLVIAGHLAQARESFQRYLVTQLFSEQPRDAWINMKAGFPGNGFIWEIHGDLRSLNPEETVSRSFQRPQPASALPVQTSKPKVSIEGYGTHFYPQLWVGDPPSPTPEDVISGKRVHAPPIGLSAKALDMTYEGKVLIIHQDGFVGLEAQTRREAMETLNEIMGTMFLSKIPATAVRERELGSVTIEPESLAVATRSSELVSLRTAQAFGGVAPPIQDDVQFELNRISGRVVPVARMRDVVTRAERLSRNAIARSHLMFLLEAHTHLLSSEYRQCIVMAWLVIESWLEWRWLTMLDSKNLPKDRRDRFASHDPWTAELRSETLSLLGFIDPTRLEKLTAIRRRRNRVVHSGFNPSKVGAEEAIKLALEVAQEGPLGRS